MPPEQNPRQQSVTLPTFLSSEHVPRPGGGGGTTLAERHKPGQLPSKGTHLSPGNPRGTGQEASEHLGFSAHEWPGDSMSLDFKSIQGRWTQDKDTGLVNSGQGQSQWAQDKDTQGQWAQDKNTQGWWAQAKIIGQWAQAKETGPVGTGPVDRHPVHTRSKAGLRAAQCWQWKAKVTCWPSALPSECLMSRGPTEPTPTVSVCARAPLTPSLRAVQGLSHLLAAAGRAESHFSGSV